MPTIYAKPRRSTRPVSSFETLPVSLPDFIQPPPPPQEEKYLTTTTTTLQTQNIYDSESLASVKPNPSPCPDLSVFQSFPQQGLPVQGVQGMAVVNALGLNLGRKIEETAGEIMLHPFHPHVDLPDAMQMLEDDEDLETTASDLDDQPLSEGNNAKTAAEVRADKRRMKRFRWATVFFSSK